MRGSGIPSVEPGALVGVSHARTEHVLRTREGAHFVCCAVDLLLNPSLPEAQGRTVCPTCGAGIRLTLTAGVVTDVTPAGAVVFARECQGEDGRTGVCCSDSAIFHSEPCLREWVRQRGDPRGFVSTVAAYAARAGAAASVHRSAERSVEP